MHGVELGEMLANAQVYNGCTVGTNALVGRKTARVGLLATRGHVDTIFIMKVGGRLKWMPADYMPTSPNRPSRSRWSRSRYAPGSTSASRSTGKWSPR